MKEIHEFGVLYKESVLEFLFMAVAELKDSVKASIFFRWVLRLGSQIPQFMNFAC
jgi:hypothetical protein